MDEADLGVPGLVGARLIGRGGFGTVYAAGELSYDLAGPGPEYLIRSSDLVTEPRPC